MPEPKSQPFSRLARESWRGIRVSFADIIHFRIPAHPRGAYIRWEIGLPLMQICYSPPIEVGVISHLIYLAKTYSSLNYNTQKQGRKELIECFAVTY